MIMIINYEIVSKTSIFFKYIHTYHMKNVNIASLEIFN